MDICRRKDGLEISELDPFLAELLRQIPAGASTESSAPAQSRIYSEPADSREICAEWKLYVEPELRRIFETATETVSGDLAQLKSQTKPFANCTLALDRLQFTGCDILR